MSQDLNHTPPAQWSREQMRAAILEEVEREKQILWNETKEKFKERVNLSLDSPPPPYAIWKAEPEEKAMQVVEFGRVLDNISRLGDLGDAQLLQEQSGDSFCHDNNAGRWYRFNGVTWEKDGRKEINMEVAAIAEHYDDAADVQKMNVEKAKAEEDGTLTVQRKVLASIKSRAKSLRSKAGIGNVLEMATSGSKGMGVSGDEWDQHAALFAAANGVVDLETGRLLRGDPKLYLRQCSPFPFLGLHHPAPFFMDMLHKLGACNPDWLDYVERASGCWMTGLKIKKIWTAYGPKGDNGKSKLFETLDYVMGSYSKAIKVDLLLEKRSASNDEPHLISLVGKRFAVASEPDKHSYFSMGQIKALTGGDTVTARGLYMIDPMDLDLACKLLVHVNHIPKIRHADPAFLRRLVVIPFLAQFTTDETLVDIARHVYPALPEDTVKAHLTAEGPGILAWLVRNAVRYLRERDLSEPPVIRDAGKAYEVEHDELGEFLRVCTTECDRSLHTKGTALYEAYRIWKEIYKNTPSEKIMKNKSFYADMKQRSYDFKEAPSIHFFGLQLAPEWAGPPHKVYQHHKDTKEASAV
jgi:putative DNA primase/helicase